jgi:type IV pilus assembly protein PilA
MQISNKKGFTLLEVLLVIGLIAILAGIVVVAINPARQITQANDTQRSSDVTAILNAVWQYTIDNNGTLPDDTDGEDIENANAKILGTSDADCSNLECPALTTNAACIDLSSDLVTTYIGSMPINPGNSTNSYDATNTGYAISQDSSGLITVQSCENDVDGDAISVTR